MKIILFMLKPLLGIKGLQKFYEKLYYIAIRGMNIGISGNIQQSGELFAIKEIKRRLHNISPIIIFDVGANIGDYSIELQNEFGKNAIIYAFEPSRNTFNVLKKRMSDFDGVNVYNIGLSNKKEEQILFSNDKLSHLSSLHKRQLDYVNIQMNSEEKINTDTIDSFCKEHKIKSIHFLKLDIEGHEIFALTGSQNMLQNGLINYIQFEFGGNHIDSKTFFRDLYNLLKDKYRIFRILKNGLFEIINYNELYEIFTTTNFLAVRK